MPIPLHLLSKIADRACRFLGHALGSKDRDDWHRMRTVIDPHFNVDEALQLLPVMVSDTETWLNQLPKSSVVTRDEKNRVIVKAEQLVSELPFMMIARRLFGELIDEEVLIQILPSTRLLTRTIA